MNSTITEMCLRNVESKDRMTGERCRPRALGHHKSTSGQQPDDDSDDGDGDGDESDDVENGGCAINDSFVHLDLCLFKSMTSKAMYLGSE